jgi:hypothetical protein
MRSLVLVSVLMLLAGCAADGRLALEEPSPGTTALAALAPAPGPACDTVTSHATSVGEGFSRSLADEAILYRIAESKGRLMQKGVRRVKIAGRRTTCREHLYLGPGLQEYYCKAEARLCGS